MPRKPPGVSAILQAVERRADTDERPSYFVHVVLPVILAIVGVGGAVAILFATVGLQAASGGMAGSAPSIVAGAGLLAIAGLLAAAILGLIGIYKVMRRHDRHFARDRLLREGVIEYGRWLAEESSSQRASERAEELERIHADATMEEPDRPPAVHLILTYLVPFWFLHVVYYLTKDFARHARHQGRFLREFRALASEAGHELPETDAVVAVNERSFLLSLLLLIPPISLVGGFVVLYWLYDDPEQHFNEQRVHEDAIVEIASDAETRGTSRPTPEETEAPEEPDVGATASQAEEAKAPPGADAEEDEPAPEPEYTVWQCPDCDKKYKVPPKRPVRVTCKNCDHQEILEE